MNAYKKLEQGKRVDRCHREEELGSEREQIKRFK